jgi:hypothetical protein
VQLSDLSFSLLNPSFNLPGFDCGDADINDFLHNDAVHYQNQRLANTYLFSQGKKPLAFFSILNDSLNVRLHSKKATKTFHKKVQVPFDKRKKQYPAIKIGRLGVDMSQQGSGLAYSLMDFIKGYCLLELKPACRLLILDAYNKTRQLKYYTQNGFEFLYDEDKDDKTRLMYFDMMQFGS